ncbi:hypothetical protein BANRA_05379 [Escherichia coli]|nr:hypothetical protein BANRA_05379 [Escherichia coli]
MPFKFGMNTIANRAVIELNNPSINPDVLF